MWTLELCGWVRCNLILYLLFRIRYNNQLTVLRNDLRFCKKKSTDQTKQLTEMQKLLAEQQKQTHEYAARLDESEKKYEEMSMKISTLLQVKFMLRLLEHCVRTVIATGFSNFLIFTKIL